MTTLSIPISAVDTWYRWHTFITDIRAVLYPISLSTVDKFLINTYLHSNILSMLTKKKCKENPLFRNNITYCLKNHWTKYRLVCIHFDAFSMLIPNMGTIMTNSGFFFNILKTNEGFNCTRRPGMWRELVNSFPSIHWPWLSIHYTCRLYCWYK